jgi:hypothetical protein
LITLLLDAEPETAFTLTIKSRRKSVELVIPRLLNEHENGLFSCCLKLCNGGTTYDLEIFCRQFMGSEEEENL